MREQFDKTMTKALKPNQAKRKALQKQLLHLKQQHIDYIASERKVFDGLLGKTTTDLTDLMQCQDMSSLTLRHIDAVEALQKSNNRIIAQHRNYGGVVTKIERMKEAADTYAEKLRRPSNEDTTERKRNLRKQISGIAESCGGLVSNLDRMGCRVGELQQACDQYVIDMTDSYSDILVPELKVA